MLEFVRQNSELVQIGASLTTTFVWLVYLHVLLRGFREQRRSSMLINRGGGDDLDARCLISNMGAQPAYLLDVLACIETEEGPSVSSVVDRRELRREELERPTEMTGQGPLPSGGYVDIGSFRDIVDRSACGNIDPETSPATLKLISVAATNQASHIVAAVREFDLAGEGDRVAVYPRTLEARQVRSRLARRRVRRALEQMQSRSAEQDSVAAYLQGI
ncbi:hypothetical protein GCM10011360_28240 [Primorskyibacter flagellatus]|uniref:Uncharacterized protein n=1 Tax=Primorskyibacter flagellatus TaxID=1387277 RepID=A0A917EG60_9RHOB|nr:hypothetical protein [Primorskyibacter flagellatus]GGE38850.1 hypothetical protein GCM10011360_28240 [Primorskyibacter flagellatus]